MTPSYTVSGSPAAIVVKAGGMRTRGTAFTKVADGLDSIKTDGWASKSAEMFREQFQPESGRWRDSGAGFVKAASALEAYASQLQTAQDKAGWCRQEWDRGERASVSAKAAYDADVARGKQDKAAFEAQGGTYTLTILPFDDPGTAIKSGADDAYSSLKSSLDGHAHTCADQVRAGCAGAPESRNWFETGLAFVGDVFVGIYEGVKGLVELAMMPITMLNEMLDDLTKLATGELTPEELAMKYQLKLEDAKALLDAFLDDPLEFAKQLGKAILDWDTWSDNPAKAIGHLVPDILLAIATLGAGTAASATEKGATGAVKGAEALDDLAGAAAKLDDVADVAGATTKLDDVADVAQLGDGPVAMPVNRFPPSEAIAGYAEKVPPKPGFYDVKLHGGPDAVEITLSDGRKVTGDQRLLSSFVNSQADYAGENLRLLSCSTGATDAGLAQNLANKMGVTVEAPSDTLWIWSNGFMHIGPAADVANGSWRVFTPGGGTP